MRSIQTFETWLAHRMTQLGSANRRARFTLVRAFRAAHALERPILVSGAWLRDGMPTWEPTTHGSTNPGLPVRTSRGFSSGSKATALCVLSPPRCRKGRPLRVCEYAASSGLDASNRLGTEGLET
jgi:hypothetical protein